MRWTKEEAMQLSRSEKTTTMNDIEKIERSRSQNVTAIENHRSIMQMPGTKEGELIKESTCAKNAHMPQMLN